MIPNREMTEQYLSNAIATERGFNCYESDCPNYRYDMNNAILLFRELPTPDLAIYNRKVRCTWMKDGTEPRAATADLGQEAVAIMLAWYEWKTGITVKLQ